MAITRTIDLVERQVNAWVDADKAAALADFASDGVLFSPGRRWHEHSAIRSAMQELFDKVLSVDVKVTRVLTSGK